jgi:hypothetical protein
MSDTEEVPTQNENLYVSPISDPLMAGKLYSKTLKLVRKASEAKAIRRGVPEVVKAMRKGQKGYVAIFSLSLYFLVDSLFSLLISTPLRLLPISPSFARRRESSIAMSHPDKLWELLASPRERPPPLWSLSLRTATLRTRSTTMSLPRA